MSIFYSKNIVGKEIMVINRQLTWLSHPSPRDDNQFFPISCVLSPPSLSPVMLHGRLLLGYTLLRVLQFQGGVSVSTRGVGREMYPWHLYFPSGLKWKKRRWGPFAIVGIKNLKTFNLELSVFSHNNSVIYIVAWFYGTINKAEQLGYDLWAGLGTNHYEQHSFNENSCFKFPAMSFTNPRSEYNTSESRGLPPAQDG